MDSSDTTSREMLIIGHVGHGSTLHYLHAAALSLNSALIVIDDIKKIEEEMRMHIYEDIYYDILNSPVYEDLSIIEDIEDKILQKSFKLREKFVKKPLVKKSVMRYNPKLYNKFHQRTRNK
jgi:ABC-type uncharacterized transport system ATPase component